MINNNNFYRNFNAINNKYRGSWYLKNLYYNGIFFIIFEMIISYIHIKCSMSWVY